MLRISKLADYATLIMSYLAQNLDCTMSAACIAKEIHLRVPTVSKILKLLCEAGLVSSLRGSTGGYRLARIATQITVADVIKAMEGHPALTECCSVENVCELDALCTIKENWQKINKMIFQVLGNLTLKDMIQPLHEPPLSLRGIPVKVQVVQQ